MRSIRFFAENIAPIDEVIMYVGKRFHIKLEIQGNDAEDAIDDEVAAVPDHGNRRARQEAISRLARALVWVEGEWISYSPDPKIDLAERMKWAHAEWDEVFTLEVANAYERARKKLVREEQKIASDPLPEARQSEPTGAFSGPPDASRDAGSPPPSGPTSPTTPPLMKTRRGRNALPSSAA